jgi:kynurenine formamidase
MQSKIIDLSHLLGENTTVYPDTVGPKFEPLNTVAEHGFAEMQVTMVLHSGTHIDAPCHILANTKSLSDFPVDKFIGKAIVVNCRDKKEIDLLYLKTFEQKIAQVDFILFYTGWQYKWNSEAYFENCPALTQEAAKWLTTFNLNGVGIDAFSVDPVISAHIVTQESLPNHYILMAKEIILIENLTNLDKLPDGIFSFQCLPVNIEHADGSPVRAIAMI